MTIAMIIFGILSVISAGGVVASRQPLNSALWLVLTLFLVAVHFALLDAHLMAAMQVLIYAGAIMVLVIFVIMLLGLDDPGFSLGKQKFTNLLAAVVSGSFAALTYISLTGMGSFSIKDVLSGSGKLSADFGTTEGVGKLMFTTYLVPFQLVGLLLLAAIIGAVLIALDKRRPLPKGRGLKDKQESIGAN